LTRDGQSVASGTARHNWCMNEPLRQQVLLTVVKSLFDRSGQGDQPVATIEKIYSIVDRIMTQEQLRSFTSDLKAIDVMLGTLSTILDRHRDAEAPESEDAYQQFRMATTLFLNGMNEEKTNVHIVALSLKVSRQIKLEKDISYESMMMTIIGQFKEARVAIYKAYLESGGVHDRRYRFGSVAS
jgi:hypothetical protein